MAWFRRRPRLDADWVARLEAVERRLKVIEVEWDDWYDKYRRLYARLAKRAQEQPPDTPSSPVEPRSAPARALNPLAAALLTRPGAVNGPNP